MQKAELKKASNILLKLPSSVTSIFSDNEKQEFTSSQYTIDNDEVVQQIKKQAEINDDSKARQITDDGVKLLQEKTGEDGLLDNVMGKFKKMDLNPFD